MSLVVLVQCSVCSYGGFLIEGDLEHCLEGLGASGRALAVAISISAFACASPGVMTLME